MNKFEGTSRRYFQAGEGGGAHGRGGGMHRGGGGDARASCASPLAPGYAPAGIVPLPLSLTKNFTVTALFTTSFQT